MVELRPLGDIRTSRVTGNVTQGPGRDQLRPGGGEGARCGRDTGSGASWDNTNTLASSDDDLMRPHILHSQHRAQSC